MTLYISALEYSYLLTYLLTLLSPVLARTSPRLKMKSVRGKLLHADHHLALPRL